MRSFFIFLLLPAIALLGTYSLYNSNPQRRMNAQSAPDTKILIISDLNAAYGSTTYSQDVLNVVAKIDAIKPDLILCAGDMVAGQQRSLTAQQTQNMWAAFKGQILEPIHRSGVPFGFTIGNHDGSPNFTQDRAIAHEFWEREKAFTGLEFVDDTQYPFYYSYRQNGLFFISWDASGAIITPQVYAWMKAQLATGLAKRSRMRIVLGHLPLYAIVGAKNKPGEVNADPAFALQFFKENRVDLYISGHQHAYFPAEKEGVVLLNAGAIGDGPRPLLGDKDPAVKAYTLLTIPQKSPKRFTYGTYDPVSGSEIKLADLPETVVGFNGTSKRITIR